ncbi:homeobox-leucine zipper protein ATHB-15-like [Pyrus x bretschneideri]|uniref:homeobox-leucine zipper protein ATHB-15-like n=1 Tax=Pyrus x bretschneideri TaxID=225117 RepID=UPI00202F035E|nr:homeobox-leucine zipper protein ATHB-15-like [Pyrus x bretschneideri]
MECPPQAVTELYQKWLKLWSVIFQIPLYSSGMDENAVGSCAELFFAPIDASFADDTPLLPAGFHIIPLDYGKRAQYPGREVREIGRVLETK